MSFCWLCNWLVFHLAQLLAVRPPGMKLNASHVLVGCVCAGVTWVGCTAARDLLCKFVMQLLQPATTYNLPSSLFTGVCAVAFVVCVALPQALGSIHLNPATALAPIPVSSLPVLYKSLRGSEQVTPAEQEEVRGLGTYWEIALAVACSCNIHGRIISIAQEGKHI